MKAIALRVLAVALVVLAIAAGWFYVKALRAELADAQNTARTAQETVGRRDATIADMQKIEREHATALAQLEAKRERIAGADFHILALASSAGALPPGGTTRAYWFSISARPSLIAANRSESGTRHIL